jgi:hypothetical protein
MSSIRRDTRRAWMAFLLTPVLVAIASVALVGATPAAAQGDDTVIPDIAETAEATATETATTPVGEETPVPEPTEAPKPDVPETDEPIAPTPVGDDTPKREPGDPRETDIPVNPTPTDLDEPDAAPGPDIVIAPEPDAPREPGGGAPAPELDEDTPVMEVIGLPSAGMGPGEGGGSSATTYGLLALGGLVGLMGAVLLTWRSRAHRA